MKDLILIFESFGLVITFILSSFVISCIYMLIMDVSYRLKVNLKYEILAVFIAELIIFILIGVLEYLYGLKYLFIIILAVLISNLYIPAIKKIHSKLKDMF